MTWLRITLLIIAAVAVAQISALVTKSDDIPKVIYIRHKPRRLNGISRRLSPAAQRSPDSESLDVGFDIPPTANNANIPGQSTSSVELFDNEYPPDCLQASNRRERVPKRRFGLRNLCRGMFSARGPNEKRGASVSKNRAIRERELRIIDEERTDKRQDKDLV